MIGLIGRSLGHSYSKQIHEEIGAYDYELIELEPDELGDFLKGGRFQGLNVTIPYKEAVIKYCSEFSESALEIGSVNTIIRRPDGSLCGHNTDYDGLRALILRTGIDLRGASVAVLGSGGTSKTACKVCADMGASEVTVISRSGPCTYESVKRGYDVIINTTPVGMYPKSGVAPAQISEGCKGVIDVIYNPLNTELMQAAREKGIRCAGGLYMLVAQAVSASKLFGAGEVNTEEVYINLIKSKLNIVLTGMPGSGKSKLGELLSSLSGRPLIDMDKKIEENEGMSIEKIFAAKGEAYFRALESEVVEKYGKLTGQIIATGGGTVLSERNRRSLRQNGLIYNIKRDISMLSTEGRPLSKSLDELEKMYKERQPIYSDFADRTIENSTDIEDAANAIWEDFNENTGY